MSRQACSVVSTLASVMGPRFEQVALQLIPQLFKMVVITVQVRVHSNEPLPHDTQSLWVLYAFHSQVCSANIAS